MHFANRQLYCVIFCLISMNVLGQKSSPSTSFKAIYTFAYKKFVSSKFYKTTNTVLLCNGKESLFTFDQMVNFATIQEERQLTVDEIMMNVLPFYYLIYLQNNEVMHYEAIGSDTYKFSNKIHLNWQLHENDTLIGNYKCKKATLDFYGRNWTAWYAPDIPISAGPYKFKGLPGLILRIFDSEKTFDFTLNEFKKGYFDFNKKFEIYFFNEDNRPTVSIEANEFYRLRKKFNEMSLDEKIKFMNRDDSAGGNIQLESATGEPVRAAEVRNVINSIERLNEP
ncbi:GLPGLI family protein [Flavobacterium sp.]|uniref:GLPGLI family protein n=1 Tax=Flavobacterium sp. TaxID=239 RepID=UPI00262562AE|nr:GLPGLI family protein [Flavobacterium sp.]